MNHSDRAWWAEIEARQTRIQVRTRDLGEDDTDCSYQVVTETDENKIKTWKEDSFNWLETEERGLEIEIITEGCNETDQPYEEKFDKTPYGWKPERLNII